eukprot:2836975-Amphidinium_carterae.1
MSPQLILLPSLTFPFQPSFTSVPLIPFLTEGEVRLGKGNPILPFLTFPAPPFYFPYLLKSHTLPDLSRQQRDRDAVKRGFDQFVQWGSSTTEQKKTQTKRCKTAH